MTTKHTTITHNNEKNAVAQAISQIYRVHKHWIAEQIFNHTAVYSHLFVTSES
jgi:hypothetical protein